MEKLIVFTADVEENKAKLFDEIAEKNFRSRSAHLKYIIEKEIEYHSKKVEAEG